MQETWVWSLGWEDPLEEGMAIHPVFLPGISHGLATVLRVKKSQTQLKWLRTGQTQIWKKEQIGEALVFIRVKMEAAYLNLWPCQTCLGATAFLVLSILTQSREQQWSGSRISKCSVEEITTKISESHTLAPTLSLPTLPSHFVYLVQLGHSCPLLENKVWRMSVVWLEIGHY